MRAIVQQLSAHGGAQFRVPIGVAVQLVGQRVKQTIAIVAHFARLELLHGQRQLQTLFARQIAALRCAAGRHGRLHGRLLRAHMRRAMRL